MNTSPYVPRPRLTGALQDHRVVLLEAGGGAGKTSLALELADVLDLAPIHVRLAPGTTTPREVAAAAAGAFARLGYPRAAAVAAGTQELVALADALAAMDDGALLIFDDVHHADPVLADELDELAHHVPEPHRLALIGRRLPAGQPTLDHDDLSLTPDECVELAQRAGLTPAEAAERAASIHAVTGGWVAPTLAALVAPAGPGEARSAWRSVQEIVDRILERLTTRDRELLSAIAALPRVNPEVATALGALGAVDAARDAGVPLRHLGGGWFVLANPFSDTLGRDTRLDGSSLREAARAYADAGEFLIGADLLRRHAGDTAAAELIGSADMDEVVRVHGGELLDLVRSLDDDAVAAHPRALLAASTVAFLLAQPDVRRELVDRLLEVAQGTTHEPLAHAEDLLERVWRQPDTAQLATEARALERAHGDDPEVSARVAEVQARVLAMEHGDQPERLATAWSTCSERWDQAGYRTQAARATVWQAVNGAWNNGHYARALELINRALSRGGASPTVRLLALTFRGMFLVDLGRYPEAEVTFARARALAHALRADVRRAHIAWFTARMASQRGDPDATLAAVRDAEAADVMDAGGGVFFAADAATLLARVGLDEEADRRLTYAIEHDPGGSEKVPLAALDVAARRGDLEEALRWHATMQEREPSEPRDRWRHRLLLAWAATGAGDDRASDWAVEAFDGAGALGHPDLPFVREPNLARELVGPAAAAGSLSAARLLDDGFATIQVLGRFTVEVPGQPGSTPTGTQAQALKFLAVEGGRVQQDSLIEALWPEVEPKKGRQRLRVVLSRLKGEMGDLVVREGDVIALAPGVTVDAMRFDDLAQRALIEGDLAQAEAAVSAYGGTLLPDDPYEPWASIARDRLTWRYLALLDRLASAASESGDLERALSLLYVGIDEEPEDEDRYLMAARLLCDQSRHSRARALLERATRVLEARELPPSPDLLGLLEKLRP